MPAFPATIFNKGGTDKTLILNTRAQVVYPFEAPDWTDLRIGFLLSLTTTGNDDLITGLAEVITNPGVNSPTDAYWIGVKSRNASVPFSTGTVFTGFCNWMLSRGNGQLVTSDAGVGATNANYWRSNNSLNVGITGMILDGFAQRGAFGIDATHHYAQANIGGGGGPAGYATLLSLRLTRNSPSSLTIFASTKAQTNSGDVLFTNTPTLAILQSNLEAFPTAVQQLGPVTLSELPDALYCYWPFHNSRLRIHCLGFVKAR